MTKRLADCDNPSREIPIKVFWLRSPFDPSPQGSIWVDQNLIIFFVLNILKRYLDYLDLFWSNLPLSSKLRKKAQAQWIEPTKLKYINQTIHSTKYNYSIESQT